MMMVDDGMDGLKKFMHLSLDPTYQDTEEAISQAIMEQETGVQRCFICNDTLHGDSEAINLHIDRCLASFDSSSQQQPSTTSNSSDQGAWDEYEWAGQTRVRATAMMEGGYGGKMDVNE